MRHFIKPSVKLGLLGGVVYIALNTSMSTDIPTAVASNTTSGPTVIELRPVVEMVTISKSGLDIAVLDVPVNEPKLEVAKVEVAKVEVTSVVDDMMATVIPAVDVIDEIAPVTEVVKWFEPAVRKVAVYPPTKPQYYYGSNNRFLPPPPPLYFPPMPVIPYF